MAEFLFDNGTLTNKEKERLSKALAPVADADAPLKVELITVSEEEIRELNAKFRGVDAVTDVLSFPAMEGILDKPLQYREHLDGYDGESLFLGSIAVCEKRMREQAIEYGHSYEREFYYLTVHGVLHCLGYDHIEEDDKKKMREKEEEVMQRMNLKRV